MNEFKKQLAPGWSGVNIGIVVLLTVTTSWVLGLVMVAYIVWGGQLGLDLSRPETLGVFFRRVSGAAKAALESFNKQP